ncbi:alkaline phosphatase family protein [Jatrophihabitans telluris]|uniref:Alkaline phosphatase family protein n=1 Tax=Jatrophihabitans telluris TaxID=2038343 RepID=A0ABY4QZ14_9ACTN|nr:alkaline phosphatase family protein [Jatrophihabitans telluris]UQX88805.1 alkaline phosphatase family protein [Jatrophihabitans telluris]
MTALVLSASADGVTTPPVAGYVPAIKHVFVINIENKGYDATWGPTSAAPYLAKTLRGQGVLLNSYYGTAHNSQPNYVAQLSGQGPNPQMQADCQVYSSFAGSGSGTGSGTPAPGQAVGSGCVFPAGVASLPTQLDSRGLSWKGYMEDMRTPCRHPAANSVDSTQKAKVGDQYAARHNPFVYFGAITGSSECAARDVDLSQLPKDLASISTTPNLTYITPNLCNDGHDAPCVDGRPGGLASVNAWMQIWVPRILNSAAFKADGELIITADESDGPQSDASACCGEGPGPNSALPGITGLGGGRIGALVLSRWTAPNTWSTTPYNHYSLLASIEDVFRLPYLGYAQTAGLNRFGLDVYNSGWNG